MRNYKEEWSEHSPAPHRPLNDRDRTLRDQRRQAREDGEPEPPIHGRYNGWDDGGGQRPIDNVFGDES